jgi:hypothetical protein
MIATPVFTPFQRISTLVGGGSVDTVNQYNQVAHVLTQLYRDVASKYGLQSMYGYSATGATAINPNLDGRVSVVNATDTFTMSAPLVGLMLTQAEKQLPLFAMPQVRLQLTLDSLSNMFFVSTGAAGYISPTSITISNFELCYTMIDLGASVEKMVYDHGAPLLIKSHGLNNSAVAVTAGAVGSNSYVFNQRFASIRSAFVCANAVAAASSKWAEIVDITGANAGDYQLLVGNAAFPQAPLSTALNKSGILQETRRATGNLYSNDTFSINAAEFNQTLGAAYSAYEPGKFIVGVNLDKVSSADHVLMSGTSTYNTPISVNVNIGTATGASSNINLILDYDAILVLDPMARQLTVRS